MPFLVRNRTAGVPAFETKSWVWPTLKAAPLIIFFGPDGAPAPALGNILPRPAPAIAIAATVDPRITPRRSSETLLRRREP